MLSILKTSRRNIFKVTIAVIVLSGLGVPQVREHGPGRSVQHNMVTSWHATLNAPAAKGPAATLTHDALMNPAEPSVNGYSRFPVCCGTESFVRFHRAIGRVEQLRPIIEPILRAEGVPSNVDGLVLVESGGLTTALSRKGARGIWQLMPDTARRYGLAVSRRRDERSDVAKSTLAAAHYLRDLYRRFGDWKLVFAAYNAGEYAVEHAVDRVGQRDFFAIRYALPLETRAYVPAVLHAISMLGGNSDRLVREENVSDQLLTPLDR